MTNAVTIGPTMNEIATAYPVPRIAPSNPERTARLGGDALDKKAKPKKLAAISGSAQTISMRTSISIGYLAHWKARPYLVA
jgi:hypothetical protein